MPDPLETTNLGLPYLAPGQAQKHVTHNEALRRLDAVVQLAVLDADRTAPPSSPAEGDRHIVAAGATGAWNGRDGMVAAFLDGAWTYFEPVAGWIAYDQATESVLVRSASAWTTIGGSLGGSGGAAQAVIGNYARTARELAAFKASQAGRAISLGAAVDPFANYKAAAIAQSNAFNLASAQAAAEAASIAASLNAGGGAGSVYTGGAGSQSGYTSAGESRSGNSGGGNPTSPGTSPQQSGGGSTNTVSNPGSMGGSSTSSGTSSSLGGGGGSRTGSSSRSNP